jgi:hypothetical protein
MTYRECGWRDPRAAARSIGRPGRQRLAAASRANALESTFGVVQSDGRPMKNEKSDYGPTLYAVGMRDTVLGLAPI